MITVTIIHNIGIIPGFMEKLKDLIGKPLEFHLVQYGEEKEVYNQNIISTSDYVIVWLNLESFLLEYSTFEIDTKRIKNYCENLFSTIKSLTYAKIFWITFEDYYAPIAEIISYVFLNISDKINIALANIFGDNVNFIDLKYNIAKIGMNNSFNSKYKYNWNIPYSPQLFDSIALDIYKKLAVDEGKTKKVLVLDCDNVLWGGVVSEDGIENIKLGRSGVGRSYYEFQLFLYSMYCHGIILAICSKNEQEDVYKIFEEHSEMVLKEEYISNFKVNWQSKSDNILKISKELNISLDSIVFVDDSEYEINEVKCVLPEVTSIKYERNTIYSKLSFINLSHNTDIEKVKNRTRTYKTNYLREELKLESSSQNEYIDKLKIQIDIHPAKSIEFSRILELVQRTNKCTNGMRYSMSELKTDMTKKGLNVYSIYVNDIFSNFGLIGVIGITNDILTLFSVSCRVLGKGIEEKIIEYIKANFNIKHFIAIDTGKNECLIQKLKQNFKGDI